MAVSGTARPRGPITRHATGPRDRARHGLTWHTTEDAQVANCSGPRTDQPGVNREPVASVWAPGASVESRLVSRPYRFAPPRPGRPLIRRSQLLQRMHERWDRRVTVLSAGPGFGKSSLLVQAIDENALAPRGDDHWLGCDAGDSDHRMLADGLASALRTDVPRVHEAADKDSPSQLGAALADSVWRSAPRQVCLV